MIKALKKLGIEEMYLNMIKTVNDKSLANILNGKPESITSKVRNERRVSTIPNCIQYGFRILSQSNKTEGKIKKNLNKEGRSQMTLFFT
jgi:hypothetical protein